MQGCMAGPGWYALPFSRYMRTADGVERIGSVLVKEASPPYRTPVGVATGVRDGLCSTSGVI